MSRALGLACLLSLAATGVARAQEEPTTAAPAATVSNGPQPVRVTTFLLKHPGLDDQALVPVMRALDDGLKRNPRLEMKDLDTRLADFAQEVPQEQIDEGRLLLQEGQKALTALDLPTAIKKLTGAVDVLSKVLPYVKKQELADAMMALGASHFENGDKKEAKRAFERLLVWRSDYKVDLGKYPPTILAIVEDVRKEVEKQKRGSLEIRSDPAAAQAYVDGRYIGVTPCFADGLITGEHWVTLKKEGFKKAVMAAQVSSKVQQLVSAADGALDEVPPRRAGARRRREVARRDDARRERRRPEGSAVHRSRGLRARDARGARVAEDRQLLVRPAHAAAADARDQDGADGARREGAVDAGVGALPDVSYEAELVETKDAPPPKPYVRPPFYKTWWFWTAAGVAVTGVVLGATLAPRPKNCGGSNFCFGVVY